MTYILVGYIQMKRIIMKSRGFSILSPVGNWFDKISTKNRNSIDPFSKFKVNERMEYRFLPSAADGEPCQSVVEKPNTAIKYRWKVEMPVQVSSTLTQCDRVH